MKKKNDQKPYVVLAAGGKGSRIQSVNSEVPKPLIPIAGKPVLQWELEELISQGFKEFLITVSFKGTQIINFLGDGSSFGCHIDYFFEEQPLGNAGALFKLWESQKLSDTFLFLIADACFSVDFNRMLKYHESHGGLATLFTHPNSHPQDSSLLITSNDGSGRVVKWLNKEDMRPKWYKNCVNAGLQILSTELLFLSGINPSAVGIGEGQRKIDLDRDVLKPLLATQRIYSYNSPEICRDMGVPERFYAVSKLVESGVVENRNLKHKQRAVFLDRDGTINKDVGFLRDIDNFELVDGAAKAIRRLNDEYLVIVITNQPVVARGEVTVSELEMIHNKMETLLGEEGAYIDGLYYCPHHPDKGYEGEVLELKIDCDCRKPKPGLIFRAARDFNISLDRSWMIGDGERDIQAGKNAGCSTILIDSEGRNYGQNVTVKSLPDAVEVILKK